MTIRPLALCSTLIVLGLCGCHQSQTQMSPLPGSAHSEYIITDIGPAQSLDINNKGQIVGQGDIQGDTNGPITVIAGGEGDGYLLTPR